LNPYLRGGCGAQVEYADEDGFLYFFQYPVEGDGGEFLPVATTRPETILGDTAVAVNPNDERYKHLVGKQCVVPHRCVRACLRSVCVCRCERARSWRQASGR
jgi:valyl-tRNA synthetase